MAIHDLLIGVFMILVVHRIASIIFLHSATRSIDDPPLFNLKPSTGDSISAVTEPDEIADRTAQYIQTVQESSESNQDIINRINFMADPDRCLYCAGYLPEKRGNCKGCGAPYVKPPKDPSSLPLYQIVR